MFATKAKMNSNIRKKSKSPRKHKKTIFGEII